MHNSGCQAIKTFWICRFLKMSSSKYQPFCSSLTMFNTLRPGHNGWHVTDDTLKCIFLDENIWISITISLKFVPKGPINNIPSLVQIMAWRRPGDMPLSEPMMVSLLTHICVTRPQWVNHWSRKVMVFRWISHWQYHTMYAVTLDIQWCRIA